jgi:hypothetical protein
MIMTRNSGGQLFSHDARVQHKSARALSRNNIGRQVFLSVALCEEERKCVMAKFGIHRTDDGLYGLQLATVNLADIFPC